MSMSQMSPQEVEASRPHSSLFLSWPRSHVVYWLSGGLSEEILWKQQLRFMQVVTGLVCLSIAPPFAHISAPWGLHALRKQILKHYLRLCCLRNPGVDSSS